MVHEANEDKILKWLCKYDSSLLLMHHRFPTSTVNVKRAAHPFSTKKYFGDTQYILVHNGSIQNAEELFCDHQELGINYYSLLQDLTFNDSEALLWDFALYMEGKQTELKASGGIAFICLKLVKGKLERMYFARNVNPLNMLRTKEGISLASEGEGESIESHMLYNWNYKAKRLTSRNLLIPSYYNNYERTWSNSGYTPGSYAGDVAAGYVSDWRDKLEEQNGKWNWKQNEKQMGGRIGNTLSRQFGHLFHKDYSLIRRGDKTVIEYEQDPKTQMMLPVGTVTDAVEQVEQRRIAEDILVAKISPITEDEVTEEYMAYLAGVRGHFEQAYWSLECDYEKACDLSDTKENIRYRRLLEKVMERIDTDPEYISEESVSNVWSKLWK